MTQYDELLARIPTLLRMMEVCDECNLRPKYEQLTQFVNDAAAAIRDLSAKLEALRNNYTTLQYECDALQASLEAERKAREEAERLNASLLSMDCVLATEKGLSPTGKLIAEFQQRATAAESRLAAVFERTRERCAKECERISNAAHEFERPNGYSCAAAIRALAPEESVAPRAFPYGEEFITKESK